MITKGLRVLNIPHQRRMFDGNIQLGKREHRPRDIQYRDRLFQVRPYLASHISLLKSIPKHQTHSYTQQSVFRARCFLLSHAVVSSFRPVYLKPLCLMCL